MHLDTINPPGNESHAVEFLANILETEGIPYQTAESAPGRGNIWARLEGGDEPALILLQHTDVVPADLKYWTTDPLSGEIKDGYVWGRGALDMKGTGVEISVIMAFTPAISSTNTLLHRAIEEVTSERPVGSRVMPGVSTGFTDSHFTRDLGIASFGFDPIVVPEAEFVVFTEMVNA